MSARATIEGLEALHSRVHRAFDAFEADCREAALLAAAAGVTAAQKEHPYQDHRQAGKSFPWHGALGLTDTSHAEQRRIGSLSQGFEAEMVWPAPYAGYVDKGTSRSAAYPYTPLAEEHADLALTVYVQRAIDNFKRAMG